MSGTLAFPSLFNRCCRKRTQSDGECRNRQAPDSGIFREFESMTKQLANRVALVTGGTQGIGAATAVALAQCGADIALVARHDGEHVSTLRKQIGALDRRCELVL